jgi:alpha-mannosidase
VGSVAGFVRISVLRAVQAIGCVDEMKNYIPDGPTRGQGEVLLSVHFFLIKKSSASAPSNVHGTGNLPGVRTVGPTIICILPQTDIRRGLRAEGSMLLLLEQDGNIVLRELDLRDVTSVHQ